MRTEFICKGYFTLLEKYTLQISGLQLNHFRGSLGKGVTFDYLSVETGGRRIKYSWVRWTFKKICFPPFFPKRGKTNCHVSGFLCV